MATRRLAQGRTRSKRELGLPFELRVWQIGCRLTEALPRLLDAAAPAPRDGGARCRRTIEQITQERRIRDRRAADRLWVLEPTAFYVLPARYLVRRCNGLGDGRPWSRRELSQRHGGRRHGLQPARVGRPVGAAVRRVLGLNALPLVERTCVGCHTPFTLTSRALERQVCSPACERERQRRIGRASAATRARRRARARQEAARRG